MFCVICGGYLLLMGLFGIECAVTGIVKVPAPLTLLRKSRWSHRFLLAYLLLTWLSALLSPYWPETVLGASRYEGALTITIYGLCFLLISLYARPTPRLLTVFCACVTGFGCLCILQLAGGNPLELYPLGFGYADAYKAYAGAYLGTIGNVGLVAAFLCIAIPILWTGLLRLNGRRRFFLLIPLVISGYVLLRMSVLAGIFGVFAGGAFILPVVLPLPRRQRRLLLVSLLLAAVLFAVLVYGRDFDLEPLHELHQILHGNWDETFGSGRIHIWKSVLQKVPFHLWLGTGPDTMLHADLAPFTRYDAALGGTIVSQIDMAHNEYLNILFHQGILALIAYLLFLASVIRHWIRNSANDPVCAMLGSAVLCYSIQAFFSFSMCITAPFFWLALALLENRAICENRRKTLCGKN